MATIAQCVCWSCVVLSVFLCSFLCVRVCGYGVDFEPMVSFVDLLYRMAGNFGRKIFWRIAENMSFGGIYFGGLASLGHNDIHSKMATRTRGEFNIAVS